MKLIFSNIRDKLFITKIINDFFLYIYQRHTLMSQKIYHENIFFLKIEKNIFKNFFPLINFCFNMEGKGQHTYLLQILSVNFIISDVIETLSLKYSAF